MITFNENEKLWVEKYRPRTIQDCILPKKNREILMGYLEKGDIPNLILCSTQAGSGKTSVARAIAEQLGFETLFINASLENGIDTLRNKITQFASTISLSGVTKCVILDESDYLNSSSFQPALRGFMEEFSQNVRFILTCNYVNKLLPPILSRCTVLNFEIPPSEKQALMVQSLKRLLEILKNENIQFDPKVVSALLKTHYPDFRRTLNELQSYSVGGVIDIGVLVATNKDNFSQLVQHLKDKNFKEMRLWVANNSEIDPQKIFRFMFDHAIDFLYPDSVPQLILSTAEYQYKSGFVADQEINTTAYFTEIMLNCVFK